MGEIIKKEMKVEITSPSEKKELSKKEVPKKKLPLWNFPLQGRSVRARNLAEATKIINTKK